MAQVLGTPPPLRAPLSATPSLSTVHISLYDSIFIFSCYLKSTPNQFYHVSQTLFLKKQSLFDAIRLVSTVLYVDISGPGSHGLLPRIPHLCSRVMTCRDPLGLFGPLLGTERTMSARLRSCTSFQGLHACGVWVAAISLHIIPSTRLSKKG